MSTEVQAKSWRHSGMKTTLSSDLKKLLTPLKLRQLAGAQTFERGSDYFAAGQVVSLAENAGKVTATVRGTHTYRVVLFAEANAIASECTCPMGAEGIFCRHCVAAALAWSANGKDLSSQNDTSPTPAMTLDDARIWLSKQSKSDLVKTILDRAATDPRFRDHLLLQAEKNSRIRPEHS
jgi:uncharacterized Zn finger protein